MKLIHLIRDYPGTCLSWGGCDRLLLDSDRMNLLKARESSDFIPDTLTSVFQALPDCYSLFPRTVVLAITLPLLRLLDLLVPFHSLLGVAGILCAGILNNCHLHSVCFNSTGVQQILFEFLIVLALYSRRGYYFWGEINSDRE